MSPSSKRSARTILLLLTAFVAVTAFLGGLALTVGALVPSMATVLSPPPDYLVGTPFMSYLLPGLVLGLVVGGTHAVAFALLLRRHPRADLLTTVAAFGVLIWIFIQMIYIPFSVLQAVYVAAGLAELGLVMLRLGLLRAPAAEAQRI